MAFDLDLISKNIGAGIGLLFGGGVSLKLIWDYVQRQRDEKPKYEQMKAERDAADVRSKELWDRNQLLERLILSQQKEHAAERQEWIQKVDALTVSLDEAKDQIRALQRQMKEIQNGK